MPSEVPRPSSRLDPRRALADNPLAAALAQEPSADARATAASHIRSRDPRARLDAAAAQLHGDRADFPAVPQGDLPDAPRRKLGL